ncbi:MAG: guanylate kinase [Xanthomonadaceae bacterium]|nr:guanylate kinase [Xanthomonadaceae bacterium]MDE1958163.1 guanylate kinase [Xanthomonadaceae bacterium]MDE2176752.1 guanylate kinase [Xanthomonadaceae bacterium]MDE2246186.1 guanylate kinase [Xanthomonadaceae bacterium]
MTGTLFIVAAPSGAGKSSLVNALLEREPGMALSISYTTRRPRSGESEGSHYHFVDRDAFERLRAAGALLEHAEVHGNLYGTSRAAVEHELAAGRDVLLEIDWQGARQIRAAMPGCVGIFILPPSRAELERRLRARGADSDAVILRRLGNSREELRRAGEFEYWIVNDRFERALDDLTAIVRGVRQRAPLQWPRPQALLDALLKDG